MWRRVRDVVLPFLPAQQEVVVPEGRMQNFWDSQVDRFMADLQV